MDVVGYKLHCSFLKSKRLLALGCKFDDWYFRFFWYILTRGFDDTDRYGNLLSNDNLATMFNPNSSSDKSLKEYLNRRGVCMHDDAWKFMKDIHSLLASTALDSPFRQMVIKKRKEENCIFISYKSCDVFEASRLFCRLVREGLNVWFDNASLDVGDEYKKVIRNVITNKAKIFIPILSPEVAAELEDKGLGICSFYSNEWRWASENPDISIFPVAIDGYNLKDRTHEIFDRIIGHETTGVDMTQRVAIAQGHEKVGYAKLLESIKNHLKLTEV